MEDRVAKRIQRLREDALAGGYTLNSDEEFVDDLAKGLLINSDRYGIESCPCRLLEGSAAENLDILCPCVYRDDDLAEYGACFCALYVTDNKPTRQVPDRRDSVRKSVGNDAVPVLNGTLAYPVFRCTVCGYLCANSHPPRACPICKAGSERFERFL